MGYSMARGKLIHEENLNSKISCQTPFIKFRLCLFVLHRPMFRSLCGLNWPLQAINYLAWDQNKKACVQGIRGPRFQ
jgi:hypothetical protein